MMPMDFERKEAIEIVNWLIEKGLSTAMKETRNFHPETWAYHDVGLEGARFDVYAGATKGVIVPLDSDFVIKFDYVPQPYCAREYANYKAAVEAGLEQYFPYTDLLCVAEDIEFYIQERAETGAGCTVGNHAIDTLRQRYADSGEVYSDWQLWDELDELNADETVELIFEDPDLCDFIVQHHINDLHMGNFGEIYGRGVIIDFSGFGSQIFMGKPE